MSRRLIKNGAIFADGLSDLKSLDRDWGLVAIGAPTLKASPFGPATSFNGSFQYLRKVEPNWQSGDSLGTITAWIKLGAVGLNATIWGSADEASATRFLTFRLSTANELEIIQRNDDTNDRVSGATVFVANKWYHVAVVSDGSVYSLYVNGVAESLTVEAGANTGDWLAETPLRDNITIGLLRRSDLIQHFNGEIRDVTYWDRALFAQEILDLAKFQTFDSMQNLVSHWHMNSTGVLIDSGWKGTGNSITKYGNPTLVNGIAGRKCLKFDGTGDYFLRSWPANFPTGVAKRTMCCWARPDALGGWNNIFAHGLSTTLQQFGLAASGANLYFVSWGAEIDSGYDFILGKWDHVAATYDGTKVRVYVNGSLVKTSTVALNTANNNFGIGTWMDDNVSLWVGDLDEAMVFNTDLSELQLRDIFEMQKQGKI